MGNRIGLCPGWAPKHNSDSFRPHKINDSRVISSDLNEELNICLKLQLMILVKNHKRARTSQKRRESPLPTSPFEKTGSNFRNHAKYNPRGKSQTTDTTQKTLLTRREVTTGKLRIGKVRSLKTGSLRHVAKTDFGIGWTCLLPRFSFPLSYLTWEGHWACS